MKNAKLELTKLICFRLNRDMVTAIQKSGQSTSDWLRQAARNRLDDERQVETTPSNVEKQLTTLKQQIDSLKQNGVDIRREIVKLQQSDAITQATQSEMRKTLTQIQRNQAAFHDMLTVIDQSFGESLEQLGQSLLNALSQQLREMLKAREEPPPRPMPPILPRTRL